MVFHEIYSAYYNTVARIIAHIIKGGAKEKDLQSVVAQYAFGESVLTILPALKSGRWQLMSKDLTTPLKHEPTMPLTMLEKRWLKAISLDRRIKLFGIDTRGLDDVEPLFTEEDHYVYDKYGDGDPFEDEGYIERFGIILEAINKGLPIEAKMTNRRGKTFWVRSIPTRLEYSEKDDKFRVFIRGDRFVNVMNLARITECRLYSGVQTVDLHEAPVKTADVTLEICDERNAFERVMLHFAHFKKRAECIGEGKYLLKINYDPDDEAEIVIRILSFGPMVRVTEPERFIDLVKKRLKKQQSCGLK